MAFDGVFLHCLKTEIEENVLEARVEKVYQPTKDEIILQLRGRSGVKKLLLSAKADAPRVHFTDYAPENPAKPPMLCMLLRKYLTAGRLVRLRQPGLERILFLDFEATNELGDKVLLTLCVEIMARHSNIMLLKEDGLIVDCVKRVDFTKSSVREILPGLHYELPPPQEKHNLMEETVAVILAGVRELKTKSLSKALQSVLQGVAPIVCRELASRACFGSERSVGELEPVHWGKLEEELVSLQASLRLGEQRPYLLLEADGKPRDYSYLPVLQYGEQGENRPYETFSALLDAYYYERERVDRIRQRSQDLFRHLTVLLERASRKVAAQQAQLGDCANRESLRVYGDLINANLHLLEKGGLFYTVENFYEEGMPTVKIPADPALTPAQNAQKYYKEYRKLQTAEQMLHGFIEQGRQEIHYLESVLDELSRADTQAELQSIRAELTQGGYLKARRDAKKQKAPKALPPIAFVSEDGFQILVGRNNTQNDRLTLKDANKQDLWLHTKEIPSSHVIIVSGGREIPPRTIEQAAVLTAYHSKARESSLVPVDFTQVKNVKKPQGAKPGKVIYEKYQTVYVNPSQELSERLRAKE